MGLSRRSLVRAITLATATLALTSAAGPAQAANARASVTACASAAAISSPADLAQVRRTVLCLLNRERARRNLPRLRTSDRLAKAAARHSRDMVKRRYFNHVSPGGSTMVRRIRATGWLRGARSYSFAENIAWGSGDHATPASIVDGWMRSPGHRNNILQRRFTQLGVGVALGSPESRAGATYTTNFGAKRR
jgi:uncharacterized protein YkwD